MPPREPIWKNRGLQSLLFVCIACLLLVRFVHLRADFPNHTFWADDHAKYSDEGWYANAAMNSVLFGHWYVPGDWAPAVVVPVWPALLLVEFHLTGVSVVAARATEVCFSLLSLLLCAVLLRRFSSRPAVLGLVVLTATSASVYIYSRVAILERPFECMVLVCVLLAVTLENRRNIEHAALLGLALAVLVLTKTTGVFLVPAILYPIWHRSPKGYLYWVRPVFTALLTFGVLMLLERHFFASHHAADAKAFFSQSEPRLKLYETARKGVRALYRGTWIDPILWPLACLALLASCWMRQLWENVLWGVSALWVAGYLAFIVYHFDGPPRYFTAMTFPVFLLVVLFTAEVWRLSRPAGQALAAVCLVSVCWNLWHVQRYVLRPEYTMANAADSVRQIIDAHPESPRLIIGHAANETTLYDGVPSIDDSNGSASQAAKMKMYGPGWELFWSDEPISDMKDVAAVRTLVPMGSWAVYDDPMRARLTLFQLLPKAKTEGRTAVSRTSKSAAR